MDEKQENVVKKLHTVLRPFMLRRLKNDVEFSLKPKIETKLYIGLTEMQKFWYQKVLTKDVSSLNALGGPDRVRLLNILMQLRKVCNHPYLFDGAEPGPPYIDGPHLWETSGKMVLLDKLLKKLQAQDSRVLIFSQMTRLLDILEDMMKIQGYQYCRIDGSTKGEDRDQYMDDFNAPNSEKFVFLLSTRAGGLGINLATADIVVLFDSDWNPQVDLQAMDRAHRIGQTKQVRVFRFVSEGTVEEKIIERAERKLYLDAAVIQQGRLMEQNTKLSKDELMTMVKFGAEEIFKSKNATITEEDIDALLAKGEERTEAMKEKIKGDMQHNLANFTLGGDEGSLYDFSGALAGDDGGGGHVFLSLPQRERKRNYDVNGYFRDALKSDSSKGKSERGPRQQKGPQMHDFQFFNRARIEELMKKDFEMATQRRTQQNLIKEMRSREKRSSKKEDDDGDAAEAASEADRLEEELEQYELSPEEQSEKEALIAEGFGDWHRRDLKCFLAACERFGRNAKAQIYKSVGEETGKMETSVRAYCKMFWERYQEIADWEKMIEKIEKGEKRIERNQAIEKALRLKVARHKNPWQTLKINYGTNKGKAFTEEEDIFLVCKMNELGYGNWEELKIAIRQAWQFRFDWFIKSRTPLELQRRCETLTRLIEKENEEVRPIALYIYMRCFLSMFGDLMIMQYGFTCVPLLYAVLMSSFRRKTNAKQPKRRRRQQRRSQVGHRRRAQRNGLHLEPQRARYRFLAIIVFVFVVRSDDPFIAIDLIFCYRKRRGASEYSRNTTSRILAQKKSFHGQCSLQNKTKTWT
jgi:SWI/SNF-related matrix-associated actin-dependent regulator of chromatin subfamily A member 5